MDSIDHQGSRHSTIRVVDVHGITHIGQGEGMGAAVRDLARRHDEAEESLADAPAFWSITPAGWAAVCDRLTPAQAAQALRVYLEVEQPLLIPILRRALGGREEGR